jgi:hypothetical protein
MKTLEKCMVCNDASPQSSAGMFIKGNFLCHLCEEMIVSLKIEDIYYPFVKDCLRKIWLTGYIGVEKRYLS